MTTRAMAEEVCSALEQRCKSKQPAPNDMSHDLEASLAAFSQNGDTRPSKSQVFHFWDNFCTYRKCRKRTGTREYEGWMAK